MGCDKERNTLMRLFSAILSGLKFLFTGGSYGKFVEGKMCPKCGVRRIKIHKKCCSQCYEKYFK